MSNESSTWLPEPGREPFGVPGTPDAAPPMPESAPPPPHPGPRHGFATDEQGAPSQFGPPPPAFGAPRSDFGGPHPSFGTPRALGAFDATLGAAGTSGLVMWPLEPASRRRRGLWIGVSAGVVALVAGLAAGWYFVGSKLIAPSSPTAAVNRFVDGLEHKDGLALLGSVSPAEVQPFRQMAADLVKNRTTTPDPATTQALLDAVNSLSVSVDGLQLTEERLDDGLSKVTFTAGTLTVDGDPQQIADAYLAAVAGNPALNGVDTTAFHQMIVDGLTQKLPYTVDIANDWAANGEAPYLVTVHEGHGWYVSPLMTMGEYLTASEGVHRGAMPKAEDVAHPASPADAAKQLAGAVPALVNGDSGPLVAVLPEAERRFVAVYLQPALDERSTAAGATQLTLTASDFDVADQTGDRATVVPTKLAYTLVENGVNSTISYDGDCVASTGDDGSSGGGCLSDIPLLGDFGLDHPGLTTVHENGGWYVSLVGTLADWTGKIAVNAAQLKAEGKLDDPAWMQQQLPQGLTGVNAGT
jgi:hypothetical protein